MIYPRLCQRDEFRRSSIRFSRRRSTKRLLAGRKLNRREECADHPWSTPSCKGLELCFDMPDAEKFGVRVRLAVRLRGRPLRGERRTVIEAAR